MGGRYRKLSHRLYSGSLGRRMREGAVATPQALAPYLIGCEHGNMIGLYRLPVAYIAADLGWPLEGASEALLRLSEWGFVRLDEGSERVWIVDAFRHEFPKDSKPGDNNAQGIAAILEEAGNSFLVNDFLIAYSGEYPNLLSRCRTPSKPLESPFRGAPARAPEQEQEQEQEEETPTESIVGNADALSDDIGRRAIENGHVAEMRWRIEECWRAHLEMRERFWRKVEYRDHAPGRPPTLTPARRKLIGEAIKRHDRELLAPGKREEWSRDSIARAAGIGLFLSKWHGGRDEGNRREEGGKLYLEPERAWKIHKGLDSAERFAQLYFEARERKEAKNAPP